MLIRVLVLIDIDDHVILFLRESGIRGWERGPIDNPIRYDVVTEWDIEFGYARRWYSLRWMFFNYNNLGFYNNKTRLPC